MQPVCLKGLMTTVKHPWQLSQQLAADQTTVMNVAVDQLALWHHILEVWGSNLEQKMVYTN
jgi:hypothetical protein